MSSQPPGEKNNNKKKTPNDQKQTKTLSTLILRLFFLRNKVEFLSFSQYTILVYAFLQFDTQCDGERKENMFFDKDRYTNINFIQTTMKISHTLFT